MKKRTKAFLSVTVSIVLIVVLGITNIIPHFTVIPDMVKVGIDYISLKKNKDTVSESELVKLINESDSKTAHPFVLADKQQFEKVSAETKNNSFTDYSKALYSSVIANADALLDTKIYPVLDYVLDEEDSILPISREVINRMIILGYARP